MNKLRVVVLWKALCRLAIAAVVVALLLWTGGEWANAVVLKNAGARIYTRVQDAPPAPVAIVFGAGYRSGVLSAILADRVRTGAELYKTHKVRKLLMTGDNGRVGYSEPDAMKAAAVAEGVPASDVVCDYAGFHTYDSLYRAREIFGVQRALLVTQTYHLHRALYTGRNLGLDVAGVSADRPTGYIGQDWFDRREFISRAQAWLDVNVLHPLPKYLGPKVADLH